MSMTCPWGCGWQGDPKDYAKHYDQCPKRKTPTGEEFGARFVSASLDNLCKFEIEVDGDTWVRLYLEASKELGKVLGRPTAEHLWAKFRDQGLLRTWGLLDKDNREIFVKMLNLWLSKHGERLT